MSIKTEIIAVGSELLRPDFQETDSLFLTARLNEVGLDVSFKTIVSDEENDLSKVIRTALKRANLIFLMGGLGPTEDDRTRETLAKVLKAKLLFKRDILDRIRERFRRRGLPMAACNRRQAFVIEGAEVLPNPYGTAPGLFLERQGRRIFVLPGPPRELQPMVRSHVLPRLEALKTGCLVRRTLRLTGLGESAMESRMKPVYKSLPDGVRVTTLASLGDLSILLTYQGQASPDEAEVRLDKVERDLISLLGPWIYSRDGGSLEAAVGSLLARAGLTVACAESCTGGLIGHRLTSVPGSSAYFLESAVVYSDRAKVRRLRVPEELIKRHGAVSAAVARAMAVGIRATSGADIGLAVTGIAGPGGARPRKPVGLVYTGLAHERGVQVRRHLFMGDRSEVKFQASQKALDILRRAVARGRER